MLLAALAAVATAGAADPGPIQIETESLHVQISPHDGSVIGLTACHPDCRLSDDAASQRVDFIAPTDPESGIRWRLELGVDADTVPPFPRFEIRRETSGGWETVELRARGGSLSDGPGIRYSVASAGYRLKLSAAFSDDGEASLRLATARAFVPRPLPGFAGGFAGVRAVAVDRQGERELGAGQTEIARAGPSEAPWIGIRNQFWGLLAQSAVPLEAVAVEGRAANLPAVELHGADAADGSSPTEFLIYAGPIALDPLRATSPALDAMLYSGLWEWLRALCFALAWLLQVLHGWIGNHGLAIMALALAVKVLMLPLTALAEHWQRQVNRTQSTLEPLIASIKSRSSGEEQSEQILALYREQGVHPLYALKSLAGFLIQIPVFIAAFAMLSENFALHAVSFLWIEDLTRPDAFLSLPFRLPFFGGHFNLLPLLMTLITVLSSFLHRDATLTETLLRRQRIRLYWMAAGFFVLFYTFPAGMVLYWTTSNLLHLLKEQLKVALAL